jgi:hypothetical protein
MEENPDLSGSFPWILGNDARLQRLWAQPLRAGSAALPVCKQPFASNGRFFSESEPFPRTIRFRRSPARAFK